jgi:XTP/dITP diphosphohydrolase
MRTICFATNNKHKIEEIRAQLGSFFLLKTLEDIGCYEELPETQNTIEGNSIQKAKYVFDQFNVSCFADDTGLEVDSLNGEPGVYSARYAGDQRNSEDNIQLLLAKLGDTQNRKAKFRTVITLAEASGITTFEGIVNGVIITEKRGTSGFGYDPVFMPDGANKTFAEMNLSEKNSTSHRAIAMNKLIAFLKEKYS